MMIRLPASSSLSWDRLYLMLYVTKETSMTIVSLFTVKWFDSSSLFKLFLNIFIYIFRLFFFFSVLKPHFLCCLCFLLHCLQKKSLLWRASCSHSHCSDSCLLSLIICLCLMIICRQSLSRSEEKVLLLWHKPYKNEEDSRKEETAEKHT